MPELRAAPQRLMEAEVTIDVGSDDDDDGSVGGIGNGGVDGGAETRGSDRRGLWSSGRVSALERNAGTPATDVPCNAGGGWEPGTVRSAMGGALQASGGPSKGEGAGSEERWEASVTGGAAGFPSQQQRQDQQDQMGAGPGRGWHECEGLMEAVRACRSSAELVDMVAARSGGGSGGGSSSGSGSDGGLSAPELVLCCSQLARVADPSGGTRAWTHAQSTLEQLLTRLDPQLPHLGTYELVVLLAATARLQHAPSRARLALMFALCEPRLAECGGGNLTTLARSAARLYAVRPDLKSVPRFGHWLGSLLDACRRRMGAFRGDELVRLIGALASLSHRPPPDWMDAFGAALRSQLHLMDPPTLAKGMMAFASLRYEPDRELVRAYYVQIYSKLPMFDDHDLATTAQAFTVLKRIIKQDFLREFLSEVTEKLPTFSATALANLLTALAQLAPHGATDAADAADPPARPPQLTPHDPGSAPPSTLPPTPTRPLRLPAGWLLRAAERLRSLLSTASPEALSNSLWALSELGFPADPAFLSDVVSATAPRLPSMRNAELVRLLRALAAFRYAPPRGSPRAADRDAWLSEVVRVAARRRYRLGEAVDVLDALSRLPQLPREIVTDAFVSRILVATRLKTARNVSAGTLAALARSLRALRHRPDFGFLHSFTQAARYMWTSFQPQEYADVVCALAEFACPAAVDALWVCEFLAVIQCRFDRFGPGPMSQLLRGAVALPGVSPGAQWMALAVARVAASADAYSAAQMCDVLVALSAVRYAPPPDVFGVLMARVTARADELSPAQADELSGALTSLVPGYLGASDGHSEYEALQLALRREQMPAAVLLHAARQSSGSGEPGQLRGGVPVYSGPPPGGGARPAQQKQKQQQARRHQSQLGQGNGTGEPPSGGRRGTGAAGAVPSSGHAHRR